MRRVSVAITACLPPPPRPLVDFFGVSLCSSLELVAGIVVACMPAARLVVLRYTGGIVSSVRSRLNASHRSQLPSSSETPSGNGASGSSEDSKGSKLGRKPHKSNRALVRDLDRNRRYSMNVTVTSRGNSNHPSSEGGGESLQELQNVADPMASGLENGEDSFTIRPCEDLSVPGQSLPPPESQIWVRQGYSVVRSWGSATSLAVRDCEEEQGESA